MTTFHGENPGAVSILHGDDKGDMDHSELGSVKVSRSLALSMHIAGTVGNVRK